jgi:hypothetical protein
VELLEQPAVRPRRTLRPHVWIAVAVIATVGSWLWLRTTPGPLADRDPDGSTHIGIPAIG